MKRSHWIAFLIEVGVMLLVLMAALGIYVGIWGWSRFKLDFYPLDSSRVGPNLCASLFLVILVMAHNEFVVIKRAEDLHETHNQIVRASFNELMHPTEQAESNIAEQTEADFRKSVLAQLDETTPGGLGTLLQRLDKS